MPDSTAANRPATRMQKSKAHHHTYLSLGVRRSIRVFPPLLGRPPGGSLPRGAIRSFRRSCQNVENFATHIARAHRNVLHGLRALWLRGVRGVEKAAPEAESGPYLECPEVEGVGVGEDG